MGTEQRYDIYDLFLSSLTRWCRAVTAWKWLNAWTATAMP